MSGSKNSVLGVRWCFMSASAALGVTVWSAVSAGPALPTPCAPGACGNSASRFVTAGAATATATQNSLTVNQTSNSAVLNWANFNVGAGGTVTFKQPGASSVALNKIYQGNPSQIFGQLNANGQIYLVNLNGFVFGSSAKINTGSLIASSLPVSLSDADFSKGILSPLQNGAAAFDATLDPQAAGGRASVLDVNGNPVLDPNGKPLKVQVVVQPGAQLQAGSQGRILLAGQNVTNGGSLVAPDGQVILAAGAKIYLQADSDPGVRGLVVEVDQGGKAWNQLTGSISTPRGNASMVGLAVNQEGRISATTSVNANGSIRLEAADSHVFGGSNGNITVASTHGGTLTLGAQSDLEILPELTSTDTAVAAQVQLPSQVTLLGEQVVMQGGKIKAPGGTLTAIAAANPSSAAKNPSAGVAGGDANARLRIDTGTQIDLSGSQASLPASANLVAVQLRSSELADDPTQRNGALHGLTVYVDARNPPPKNFANVQGQIDSIPQNIAQRTEKGGSAIFQSEGDAVFAKGASLDVSGGSTTYAGGVLQTSYLVGANGQLYPIETANPLLTYVGVINPTFSQSYNKWGVKDVVATPGLSRYQPGYVQGAAAGSVQFAAPNMVLQGALQGNAVNGLYQRTASTAVAGGSLTLGLPKGVSGTTPDQPIDYLSPAVRVSSAPTALTVSDDSALPGPLTLELPLSYLTASGFTSTQIFSNYDVTLPANQPINLPAGSTLSVNASRVDVLSNVTDPAGSLSFHNVYNVGSAAGTSTSDRPGVYVGPGVTLDVRGQFVNDSLLQTSASTAQIRADGGSVDLALGSVGARLAIGDGASLRTSGGAAIDAKGAVTAGKGGSIAMSAGVIGGGLSVGSHVALDGFGVNGAAGGSFSLGAPRIEISNGTGDWTRAQSVDDTLVPGGVFQLYSNLFSDFGFQSIALTASGLVTKAAPTTNVFTVDAGTTVNASVASLLLNPNTSLQASAASLEGLATRATALPNLRPAASLNFSAMPAAASSQLPQLGTTTVGDLSVGAGASLITDAGGSIALTSLGSILVDGALRAPGGKASLHIVPPSSPALESGFLPNQRIELGAGGVIDVGGVFVPKPVNGALTPGTLLPGGGVSLLADRGYVLTDPGSYVSVAGAAATFDVLQANGQYVNQSAASAAGSVTVHSGEAISLLGTLAAAAGPTGTTGPAAGGSLDVALTRAQSWWSVNTVDAAASFSSVPMTVKVVSSAVGQSAAAATSNLAVLGAAQIAQSGLDALRLESGQQVEFDAGVALSLARSFTLDAPVIAATGSASVSAPYSQVGYATPSGTTNANSPTGGVGALTFSGSEIDLLGSSVFQGISNLQFVSSGDLLLRGVALGTGPQTYVGSLNAAGNLYFAAGRIYPVTVTNFSIGAVAAPGQAGRVTIAQVGSNPGAPLSAGATLAINANTISSSGSLYAPFGSISLTAADRLTLADGSVTSVSGNGLTIPYGQTQFNGKQWLYAAFGGTQTVSGIPNRAINLNAPNVAIQPQAAIDLTGGGDLAAFEWVPGTGGTTDALANPTSAATGTTAPWYAIVPSTVGRASPLDPQSMIGSTIGAGQSVYLSGGGGLAAGVYPLLPARYALEPGAFLIQLQPQLQSVNAGSLGYLADGTPVIAGFFSFGATGLHQTPGYQGFAIHPGSYGRTLAQYDVSLASTFFSAIAASAGKPRPTLPADAAALAINVTRSLDALGQVHTTAASGGRAAPIEISARDLVVGSATATSPADAVTLSGSVLESWQPGSLLLGGSLSADGSKIDVLANSVTIGSGTSLSADQLVLVANQTVDVQNGASLRTTSALSGGPVTTLPTAKAIDVSATSSAGASAGVGAASSPAFLALSDSNWLLPNHSAGSSAAGGGVVTLATGSTIASRGSLSLDGAGGVTLDGSAAGLGAEWSLNSSSVAFVPKGTRADALSIGPDLLAQLATGSAVRLASTGAMDLMAPVTLGVAADGTPSLGALTLIADHLTNAVTTLGTSAAFGARTLTLSGMGSSAVAGTAGPSGTQLSLTAGTLDLGPNALAINGFATTQATVSGAAMGTGSGSLNVGGDLNLAAAVFTAGTGATTALNATGALSLAASGGNTALPPLALGGGLAVSGASVEVGGTVRVPTGFFTIDSGGDVHLRPGAIIDASGALVSIGNRNVGSTGGTVAINALGSLSVDAGSTIDVAGVNGAAGGSLLFGAGAAAALNGTLKGGGPTGNGGSFALDAGSLVNGAGSGLSALADALTTGGFDRALAIRARGGDLVLDAGKTLSANAVNLTADAGSVSVGGTINAFSAGSRGSLKVYGGSGVTLASGAALHADGAGAAGLGGEIQIGTGRLLANANGVLDGYGGGTIRLETGSTITTTGAAGLGRLLLRAPALVASNDIAIGSLASNTSQVGQIIIEPMLAFNTTAFADPTAPSAADFAQIQQSVGAYMASAVPAITTRLAGAATPTQVQAAVDLIAPGSLTFKSADGTSPVLDLSASASGSNWRFGGAPVDLTIRAGGNINLSNTLTDGFGSATFGGVSQPVLMNGPSSSFHLVAGADLASADPLAIHRGGPGSLVLGDATSASVAVVRTSTGNIDLLAAQDIVIATAGSGAYTAGTPAIAPGGTAQTPYPGVPTNIGSVRTAIDPATGSPYAVGVVVPKTSFLMSFPTGGGNLHVSAGRDIQGATLTYTSPSIWQLREGGNTYNTPNGKATVPAEWGINLAAYNWNFGTLGGGDLGLSAGRDALNVTATAAGSLLPQYGGSVQYVKSGGLDVSAGRDLGSVQVFLADGAGRVTAGGALSAIVPSASGSGPNVGSAFYLQNSALDISARQDINVAGAFNPTALGQLGDGSGSLPNPMVGYVFSYGDASKLTLRSASGNVIFGAAAGGVRTSLGTSVYDASSAGTIDIMPATLEVAALGGSLSFGNAFGDDNGRATLFPSATGQIDLLTAKDILGQQGLRLGMSDAPAGSYATVATPLGAGAVDAVTFAGAIHAADSVAAVVTAGGDINSLALAIPKAATLYADGDILDFTYSGQNLNANDQTLISAGRDFSYSNAYSGSGISVGGPGQVALLAGRNVSLGFSQGVITTGNLLNPNLPTAQGASLTIATGLGTAPNYADFLTKIVAPSSTYQSDLVTYVEKLQGSSNLTFSQASTAFAALPMSRQQPFIDGVFFNELLLSGRAANATPKVGFSQGYAAIDALFPGSRSADSAHYVPAAYAGNLTLDFSRIYTLSGGNINLVVPGGLLDVGLANPPAILASRPPSTLGIVAQGAGNVDIYTRGNVDVNASRIFTLGGGNILIWSNEGSIDAGRGAKTALSAPPPSVLINSDGTVSLDFSGAASGSGIRTIQTNPALALGNVDLIAPVGTVNAGDAGIGAAGNINVAASQVVGLNNITFGGTSTGVPSTVSNIGASLSGASAAASSTSNASTGAVAANAAAEKEAVAPLAQTALAWLDVFVTGLGEENCKPDDIECLKRQKTPTR